ncbi:MAG: phosphatidate cytidylyltransferase [Candidatus Zixiibacteriota bacterium]
MTDADASVSDTTPGATPTHASAPARGELAYRQEVWRKLLHLFALTIPIGYHFVAVHTASIICFVAFTVSLLVDLSRMRNWSIQRHWVKWTEPIVRPKERTGFTGATNILASAWLCPLLFSTPAAAMGMVAIILGDSAAALVGRRWGRHRIRTGRTVEGSLAFLGAALVGGILIPSIPIAISVPGAVIAAIVEAMTRRVDDNLSVPLIVGLFTDIALKSL